MKAFLVAGIVLLVVVVSVHAQQEKECTKASDCGENECCARSHKSQQAYCRPLKTLGTHCDTKVKADGNGVYSCHCPCVKGLECFTRTGSRGHCRLAGTVTPA
uniref:Clone 988 transcribed RNA sequence n=1 Tax=Plectreurys tristis TaxID=33319 RepID=A0A0C4W5W6_PLETR|nr:venom peptide U7-PLTX-Pt1b [Plectreurys tristis]